MVALHFKFIHVTLPYGDVADVSLPTGWITVLGEGEFFNSVPGHFKWVVKIYVMRS